MVTTSTLRLILPLPNMQNRRLPVLRSKLRGTIGPGGSEAYGEQVTFNLEDPFQGHAFERPGGVCCVNRHGCLSRVQFVCALQSSFGPGDRVLIAHDHQFRFLEFVFGNCLTVLLSAEHYPIMSSSKTKLFVAVGRASENGASGDGKRGFPVFVPARQRFAR
jgi:hypothetical protein